MGLLGGSFNLAHEGHFHISNIIKKTLNLDYIWWLVSPQNPLKSTKNMLPFERRMASALTFTKNNFIIATDIEKSFKNYYTINVINKLRKKFPKIKFVWIMGADNLVQFPKWHKWQDIIKQVTIAVYDRDPSTYKSLGGLVATKYRHNRIEAGNLRNVQNLKPPKWCFLRLRKHPLSSTELRKKLNLTPDTE